MKVFDGRLSGIRRYELWVKKVVILRSLIIFMGVLAIMSAGWPVPASSQDPIEPDYRLNVGDKVYLSVPQRPTLNRTLTIEDDGTVSLPLIGAIRAAGLTLAEFQTAVLEALQTLYASVDEVNVTVEELAGKVIYVTGQVAHPGKYSFAELPTLWEAIREAGGPLEPAGMEEVRIVKDETKGGGTSIVDVREALESGSVDDLPTLESGDTVFIPRERAQYTGLSSVTVAGEVLKPGTYRLDSRSDLMSAILLAGGPTRRAKLEEVRIIRPQEDGSYVTRVVDLQRYLSAGDAASNPLLEPGSTISVPEQNAITYQLTNNVGVMLGILTSILSIAWLVVRLQD
jgi:polysaccharide export outer membrane protein